MDKLSKDCMRILTMIPVLRNRSVALQEVSDNFKISLEEARKLIRKIFMICTNDGYMSRYIDLDLNALETQDIVEIRDADFVPQAIRFTPNEIVALTVALQTLKAGSKDLLGLEALDTTIAKIRKMAGEAYDVNIGVLVARGDPEIFAVIETGIKQKTPLELSYRNENYRTIVEPYAIIEIRGYAYLYAWSREKIAWRTYRLDRISAVTVLPNEAFGQRKYQLPPQSWESAWQNSETVTIRVDKTKTKLLEDVPVKKIQKRGNKMEIELYLLNKKWLYNLLLALGGDTKIVNSAEMNKEAKELANQLLELYRSFE